MTGLEEVAMTEEEVCCGCGARIELYSFDSEYGFGRYTCTNCGGDASFYFGTIND